MINALNIDALGASGVLEGISDNEVEEITKKLMDNSITDHGEKPFAYGIATMNLSGVSKPEVTEPTKKRKQALNLILRKTQLDIILWQECKWVNPLNHINTNYLKVYTRSGDEAGIIWNSDIFDIHNISIETLFSSKQIDSFPKLKENRARLCIGKVNYLDEEKDKRLEDYKVRFMPQDSEKDEPKLLVNSFIIMSWHGPSTGWKLEDKKELLGQLIYFSGKKFKDDPILIGGDFNLKISEAHNIVENKSKWCIADSEETDPSGRKEHIDYFLVYKLHISNVSYESLTLKDPGRIFSEIDEKQITDDGSVQVDPNKLLDHSPHLADLDLGS